MQFYNWLMKQSDRDDPIGDLAKDAKRDKTFPKNRVNILGHLRLRGADSEVIKAAREALKEYKLVAVDTIKPGSALDVLIAEEVMGWREGGEYQGGTTHDGKPLVFKDGEEWRPSLDIAAAWEVADKFKLSISYDHDEKVWIAASDAYYLDTGRASKAKTAPFAICLAALRTSMEG